MKKTDPWGILCASLSLIFSIQANAALVGRLPITPGGTDYQAVYDTDLDITWLANANYAATELTDERVDEIIENNTLVFSDFHPTDNHILHRTDFQKVDGVYTGRMKWWGAMAWVDQVSFGGHDDWRLTFTMVPDGTCTELDGITQRTDSRGYNCSGSEMGHLFYIEFDGEAGQNVLASGDPDLDLFIDIQAYRSFTYWSFTDGTDIAKPNQAGTDIAKRTFNYNSGWQGMWYADNRLYAWAVADGDIFAPEPTPLADGDINIDGFVNVADVLFGLQVLSSALTLTPTQLEHADVAPLDGGMPDPDGLFTQGDLLISERKVLGLINF